MEALVHDRPQARRTYAQHCQKAFVLGTSFKHYRCWRFWSTTTRATRISGAAFFKHKHITTPHVTPEDRVIAAAGALAHALHNKMPAHMQQSTLQTLTDLHTIFHQAAAKYNTDTSTHTIPASPPRVPISIPDSPATPPRVEPTGTLPRSPIRTPPPSRLRFESVAQPTGQHHQHTSNDTQHTQQHDCEPRRPRAPCSPAPAP